MKPSTASGSAIRAAIVLVLALALLPAALQAEIPEESGDLMDEIEVVRSNMPGSGSEGFTPPSTLNMTRWRLVCDAFLDDQPEAVDSLVSLYFPSYEIVNFVDTEFEDHHYRMLRETIPPDLAWGTYVLRVSPQREIAIEVPHGRYETNTPSEGIDIFRRTGSRLFMMNGAHRCANSAYTPCDGSSDVCGTGRYHISDMGHVTKSAYQAMHEAYTLAFPDGYSFSIHGMSQTDCNDIFLSNGTATGSKPMLYELRDSMNASGDIVVSVAGDGTSTCSLVGSTNVQGRFTNGSPQPCYTPASSNNGRFIHAEQLRRVRDSYAIYSKFINAINEAIDTVASVGPNEVPKTPGLYLSVPWPNPSASAIRFYLSSSRAQQVTVEVFDVSGARVATIYQGPLRENDLVNLVLQSDRFSSGVYFVRATGSNTSATRKVTLMH